MLNDLKAEVFITAASIVKHSQKQKQAVNKLKYKFLSTLYPISENVMELPNDGIKVFSSRVIENGVKRKKIEEEKNMFDKERENFPHF